MNKFMLLIYLFFISANLKCYGFEIYDRDAISSCVVYLRQETIATSDINGVQSEIWYKLPGKQPQPRIYYTTGTGFFISKESEWYLVTASHVANKLKNDAQIILKGTGGASVILPLSTLYGSKTNIQWTMHPEADVAVLRLSPSPVNFSRYLKKHFLPYRILSDERQAPSRRKPLTMFGFPLDLGYKDIFSPLTKQTYPASDLVKLTRSDNGKIATFFIIEDPSIGGYSGGPVFDISMFQFGGIQLVESDSKLVGLIHGTISDPTGGKLAAIVPSYFIIETITLASSNVYKK